jgi:hypothetical protein
VALLGAVMVSVLPVTATAEPEKSGERAACADSYRSAQTQRRSGALRRARESLLVCVSDRCPAVLHPDCMRWLTEVEAAMPSVSFAAKGEGGRDITDVRVSIDGQLLTDVLDGKSIAVDPGSHTLRFEHSGEAPIEQALVVREGEKSRVVNVSWAKPTARDTERGPGRAGSGPPVSAWIFGGVGAVSLATFGVLALHGMERRSTLEKECFGSCDQSRIDSIKSELAIADVALGVGVVSVGIATVLFLTSGSSEKSSSAAVAPGPSSGPPSPEAKAAKPAGARILSVGVAPTRNGGALGLSGSF